MENKKYVKIDTNKTGDGVRVIVDCWYAPWLKPKKRKMKKGSDIMIKEKITHARAREVLYIISRNGDSIE